MVTQVVYSSLFPISSFVPSRYNAKLGLKFTPQLPSKPEITFTDASGQQIPVQLVNDSSYYHGSNGTHIPDGSIQDDYAGLPSIDAIVQKETQETRWFESLQKILWKRWAIRKYAMEGHHFGGNHPGKNKRQGPSLRHLGESLQDPYEASRVLGLPMLDLYLASHLLNDGSTNGHNAHPPARNKR